MADAEHLLEFAERIARLEEAIRALPERLDERLHAADRATRQIVQFNSERIEKLTETVTRIGTTLETVVRKVDQLPDAASIAELQSEIAAAAAGLGGRVGELERGWTRDGVTLDVRVDRIHAELDERVDRIAQLQRDEQVRRRTLLWVVGLVSPVLTALVTAWSLQAVGFGG